MSLSTVQRRSKSLAEKGGLYFVIASAFLSPLTTMANETNTSTPSTNIRLKADKTPLPEWIPVDKDGNLNVKSLFNAFDAHMDTYEPAYRSFYKELKGIDLRDKDNEPKINRALENLCRSVFKDNREQKIVYDTIKTFMDEKNASMIQLSARTENTLPYLIGMMVSLYAIATALSAHLSPNMPYRKRNSATEC